MSIFISYSYILILINVSITYIVSIDEIGERECSDESADDENGFNEARCIIWTLGEYFFISCSYILILIDVFITYIVFIDEIPEREGCNDENGFKQRQTCCLDLR